MSGCWMWIWIFWILNGKNLDPHPKGVNACEFVCEFVPAIVFWQHNVTNVTLFHIFNIYLLKN
jgi:hypothetical protein